MSKTGQPQVSHAGPKGTRVKSSLNIVIYPKNVQKSNVVPESTSWRDIEREL